MHMNTNIFNKNMNTDTDMDMNMDMEMYMDINVDMKWTWTYWKAKTNSRLFVYKIFSDVRLKHPMSDVGYRQYNFPHRYTSCRLRLFDAIKGIAHRILAGFSIKLK